MASTIPSYIPLMTGDELRQLRERLGLTRADLAHHLGFADESRIRAYECGFVVKRRGRRVPYLIPDPLAKSIITFIERYTQERQEDRAKVLNLLSSLPHAS